MASIACVVIIVIQATTLQPAAPRLDVLAAEVPPNSTITSPSALPAAPPAVGGVADPPVRVTVLGDSVADTIIGGEVSAVGMQFTPWTPEQSSFDAHAIDVRSITKPGCSFLPDELAILEPNGTYSHASMERFCDDWRAELSTAVASTDVLMVHLSNDLEDRWVDGELFPFGTAEYFEYMSALLDEVHRQARRADVEMLLVADAARIGASWRDEVGVREGRIAAFYEAWAAQRQGVTAVDLGELICPDGLCAEDVDGVPWRWDGRHYTRAGALAVANWLEPTLLALGAGSQT